MKPTYWSCIVLVFCFFAVNNGMQQRQPGHIFSTTPPTDMPAMELLKKIQRARMIERLEQFRKKEALAQAQDSTRPTDK